MELQAGWLGDREEGVSGTSLLIWGLGPGVKRACASNSEERSNQYIEGRGMDVQERHP